MADASFEYTVYIHGGPDDVWRGFVDPELTARYWMHRNESEWEPGSPWLHRRTNEEGTIDVQGEVLEIDRPRRLVLSWATPKDPDKVSKVTLQLAPQDDWPHGPWTGLTLTHSELDPDGEMLPSISYGWPAVLSGLKTILERPEIFGA